MVHAIGITVGGNSATRQGRADTLSNWKAYAAADGCRKAIFSVQLAQNGMTDPSAVFEGRYGFFKVRAANRSRHPSSVSRLGFAAPFSTWPVLSNRRASCRGSKVVLQKLGRTP